MDLSEVTAELAANLQHWVDRINAIPYWYHKIDLGGGIVTPGWAPLKPDAYGIPERMDGERVLDVGCWDGYWTFEAAKRGAKYVEGMEDFSDTCGDLVGASRENRFETFDLCSAALGLKNVWRFHCNIENFTLKKKPKESICYDRVFMFGVLYHLRNPVLALQNCFDAMKSGGVMHVETAILDDIVSNYTGQTPPPGACYAEFYPTNEFGKNQSNWWVPTLKCAASWLHAVGFREIEAWKLTDSPQSLAECRGFLRAKKA